ncbi:MAG: hypothetical protein JXD23_13870 [Spirochaetales bacterium]|nr:hypothetical protein [Spirochaetales bacterium]
MTNDGHRRSPFDPSTSLGAGKLGVTFFGQRNQKKSQMMAAAAFFFLVIPADLGSPLKIDLCLTFAVSGFGS